MKNITVPVLAYYGEANERIAWGGPKLDDTMKRHGKFFDFKIYDGAPHSFDSDDSPRGHREEAAKEAWVRTLAFFK